MSNNHIVIMAGGVGSRFWPLSTPEYPKQFIDILGVATRLYNSQLTVSKVSVLLITSG
jgi:mannose-1-phosphate guanylyltransferase